MFTHSPFHWPVTNQFSGQRKVKCVKTLTMKRDEDQSPELSMSLEHYQASRKKNIQSILNLKNFYCNLQCTKTIWSSCIKKNDSILIKSNFP